MEQRSTFNQVADLYDAARPGYPQALIDDLLTATRLISGDAILEVGCGTGQATRAFACRGFRIVALDPGAELLNVARQRFAGNADISFVNTTFEAWPAQVQAFRLVIAAQSWHWIPPAVSFPKAAEALMPGGWLAVFGHVPVGLDAVLLAAFEPIYKRHFGVWGPPPEVWYLPTGPLTRWFEESGRFTPVEHRQYAWAWPHAAASFLAFSRTRSDHRLLSEAQRETLFAELAKAIEAHGGSFEMRYETHLYMAAKQN